MSKDNFENVIIPKKNGGAKEESGLLEEDLEFRIMLKKYFVKTSDNKFSEIVKAIEDGNIDVAHRLAHTLKGNAAQLDLAFLKKAAADVECQLKNGINNVTKEQLMNLEIELKAALNELKQDRNAG